MRQIKSINSKHRLMMLRLMQGEKATDIAKDMGMSDSTFSVIRNSPLFKAELERQERAARYQLIATSNEVAEIINAKAPEAARRLGDLVGSEDERIALNASEKVINYSDFGRAAAEAANKPIVISQQQMVLIEEGMTE